MPQMIVYLDNYCYNRPFDDQTLVQQYDMGYGDYTKEKQEQPDISLDEIDMLLRK